MTRNEVIKGLEVIVNDDWMWKKADYYAGICKDALALLKAQEPVEYVVHCKNADLNNGMEFACGECGGSLLHKKVNYCPWCGRAVKWE